MVMRRERGCVKLVTPEGLRGTLRERTPSKLVGLISHVIIRSRSGTLLWMKFWGAGGIQMSFRCYWEACIVSHLPRFGWSAIQTSHFTPSDYLTSEIELIICHSERTTSIQRWILYVVGSKKVMQDHHKPPHNKRREKSAKREIGGCWDWRKHLLKSDDIRSMEVSGYLYTLTSAGLVGIESSRNIYVPTAPPYNYLWEARTDSSCWLLTAV